VKLFRHKKITTAVVLGCGPAGLFAAHEFIRHGWSVSIFSKEVRRSEMFGAQYLHAPILGLDGDDDPFTIDYQLKGSAISYKDKVYWRPRTDIEVSPESLVGTHPAWDIRRAYYDAWSRYGALVERRHIDDIAVKHLTETGSLIVSSIPAMNLCIDRAAHQFQSQSVWAVGDAPERGVTCPVQVPMNTVVCNGEGNPSWYRASNIQGYKTCEWPMATKPPLNNVALVTKPVKSTCVCFPSVVRVGRYGTWTKGVLAHTAAEVAARYVAA